MAQSMRILLATIFSGSLAFSASPASAQNTSIEEAEKLLQEASQPVDELKNSIDLFRGAKAAYKKTKAAEETAVKAVSDTNETDDEVNAALEAAEKHRKAGSLLNRYQARLDKAAKELRDKLKTPATHEPDEQSKGDVNGSPPAEEITTPEASASGVSDAKVVKYFDQPAHFSLPSYGINGCQINSDGALIYEGMCLEVEEDGRYRMRCRVGTPAMPVTLRLQFKVADTDNIVRSITLPPISIPERQQRRYTAEPIQTKPVHANVQEVSYKGRIPASLASRLDRVIERKGTCRFGFGVEVP